MAIKKIEIDKVGNSIQVVTINIERPNAPEYFPVSKVKAITPIFNANIGYNDTETPTPYPFRDMAVVVISFQDDLPDLRFDVQTVLGKPTWLPTVAGLTAATAEINGWI